MISNPQLRRQGLALLEKLHGGASERALVNDMAGLCPDFVDMSIEWALGGIMSRPGLDLATRELILVASCATLGHPVPQLKAHAEAALRAGATRDQIIECVLQLTFYAGGAAVRNALVNLKEVLTPVELTTS